MPQFDPNRNHLTIRGDSPAVVMQDGEFFDSQGKVVSWADAAMPVDPEADRKSAGEKAQKAYDEFRAQESGKAVAQEAAKAVPQAAEKPAAGAKADEGAEQQVAPEIGALTDEEVAQILESRKLKAQEEAGVSGAFGPRESAQLSPDEKAAVDAATASAPERYVGEAKVGEPVKTKNMGFGKEGMRKALLAMPAPQIRKIVMNIKDENSGESLSDAQQADLDEHPAVGTGMVKKNVEFILRWAKDDLKSMPGSMSAA